MGESNATMHGFNAKDVTVVVVPRERFSHALASLESIQQNTDGPFELIYIDGHGPPELARELERRAAAGPFRLIRSDHYLSPNAARNLALPHVTTKYLAFVDNDVIVTPGWLGALVACAEEHGCTAVCPLTFEDEAFSVVHHAGGELLWRSMGEGRRWLTERRPWNHLPLVKVKEPLVAGPTELNEFHCVLVRTDFFAQNGPLDEGLLSMAEETDFSIAVAQSGGSMVFEPASRVSYIPPSPDNLLPSDKPFFELRWSSDWVRRSVDHMVAKHNLDPVSPVAKHWLRFVFQHRHACATGSRTMPAMDILFGDFGSTLGKREKYDQLLRRLSTASQRGG